MALQSSGPISIGNINTEFNFAATTPRSLGQLYRNGGIVGAGAPNVPTSGAISLSQFYGASNLFNYVISTNQTNLNLRNGALAAGWDGAAPLVVTINSGVYVSSNSNGTPALTVNGSFPGGVSLTNNGFIVGMGGAGGTGSGITMTTYAYGTGYTAYSITQGSAGGAGGVALAASTQISVTNNGTIAGGGGGGGGGGASVYYDTDDAYAYYNPSGGGGGGGGRSSVALNSASGGGGASSYSRSGKVGPSNSSLTQAQAGTAGTFNTPGSGGPGGYTTSASLRGGYVGGGGGGWGAAGATPSVFSGGTNASSWVNTGSNKVGGSGGAAVSGNANITWVATGTRLGAIS